ncbi:hypothetical protein C5750_01480 [Phyllobacterium myrsinacearum]|uniref:Uncharacterized protein n=1 Tax=Phyllobacterium myrsinacearum TaxID=28101 RepID=A0A2S9JWZ5_9HYPH|nr:hypothetical protein C5750_01480 [Phyllobacterium myrsinacearum]
MLYAMLAIQGPPAPAFSGFARCTTTEPNLPGRTRFFPREAKAPILSRLSKVSGSIPAGKDEEKDKRGWENVDKLVLNFL